MPPTPTPEPTPFHVDEIAARAQALISEIDGQVGVSLIAVDGTVLFEHDANESMEAASIYKLPIMVEVFRQIEDGLLALDSGVLIIPAFFNEGPDAIDYGAVDSYYSVESLLHSMITLSSNVASYALLNLVGNENVNATMRAMGLNGIEIRWTPRLRVPELFPDQPGEGEEWVEPADDEGEFEEYDDAIEDEDGDDTGESRLQYLSAGQVEVWPTLRADSAFNVVSARSVAELLRMIALGEAVSPWASEAMMDLLWSQQIPGGLAMQLPPGVVAHKTGYLPDGVVNDAGIISTPAGPVVAVVLTEHVREDLAFGLMSELGLLVFEAGSTGE